MNKHILKAYQLLCAHVLKICCGVTIALLSMTNPAFSQLPFGFTLNKLTGNVINGGTDMAHAPDGRIFITELSGALKVLKNGVVSTVTTVPRATGSEQGLLGITLHPDFASNGKLYIFYTNAAGTVHYLDMLVISATNTVSSTTRIMQFDPILNGAHNGGALLFKDGLLYVAIGESNVPEEATKLDTYRGKILRLTEDGQPAPGNPYYNEAGASRQKRSIWAIGMRNPWKMALDPVSKKIFVINVGGGWEEINDVTSPDPLKNYNYGWDQRGQSNTEQDANTILPVFAYRHDNWGCAITSGVFFNPPVTNYPAQYRNRFFFTDYCSDWLRSIDASTPTTAYTELSNDGFTRVLGASVGIDGNLYYINYGDNGSIMRLEYNNVLVPSIVNDPVSQTAFVQDAVTFNVNSSGAVPFTYQWQKNGVNISGATAVSYSIASVALADSGNYRVIVTNANGKDTSANAKLTVKPFNAKPVVHITSPATSFTWAVGDSVRFSGTATDTEEGTLPASAYRWEVLFFHKESPTDEHSHPSTLLPQGVKSGSFAADNQGEHSPNVWLRLYLTVTDATGRKGIDSVDIQPKKVTLTADANIKGLDLVLGDEYPTPISGVFVVNSEFVLEAITPQILRDTTFVFSSWSNGGAGLQRLRVPNVNTSYKATYTVSSTLQNPYRAQPATIPGKIEIEDFDRGGEGIAYHDASTANQGNQYRPNEGVDLENCSEGGFNIGYVATGEWLEYTVNVTAAGAYTFTARVANPGAAKPFHAELDGQNITGNITVPTTGGFQAWQDVTATTPALTAGVHVLRISLDAADYNINYVTFSNGTTPPVGDTTTPPTTNPGTNLALNKKAYAYSLENGPGMGADKAVDGNQGTRWSSAFVDPNYMFVDLGAVYNISQVKIYWENAFGKNYEIQVSNDTINWSRVKQVIGNTTVLNDFTGLTASGRYVRIYGTVRNTQYGYSINELEVYGTAAGSLAYMPEVNADIVKVYPNPAYSTLTISGAKNVRRFTVINLSTSQSTKMESTNGTLNVSNLPAGTYLVEFKDGNKVVRKKFVKL